MNIESKLSFGYFLGIFVIITILTTLIGGLIPGLLFPIVFVPFCTRLYDKTIGSSIKFTLFNLLALVAGLVIRCAGFKWSTFIGFMQ